MAKKKNDEFAGLLLLLAGLLVFLPFLVFSFLRYRKLKSASISLFTAISARAKFTSAINRSATNAFLRYRPAPARKAAEIMATD